MPRDVENQTRLVSAIAVPTPSLFASAQRVGFMLAPAACHGLSSNRRGDATRRVLRCTRARNRLHLTHIATPPHARKQDDPEARPCARGTLHAVTEKMPEIER